MNQSSQIIPTKLTPPNISNFALGSIIITGFILVTLIFALLTYQIYFLKRINLGVQINGVEVSRFTRSQVEHMVANQAAEMLNRPINLTSDGERFTFTASELGAGVDAKATVDLAYSVGRTGSFWGDLTAQKEAIQHPVKIVPVITFDSGPANAALQNLADNINRPVKDAQLILDNDLTVEALPAQTGRNLDVESGLEAIREAILLKSQNPVNLTINTIQPTISTAEPVRQQLEAFLSQPLTLLFDGQTWSISPEILAQWLIIENTTPADGAGQISARLNEVGLTEYFNSLAWEINQQPVDAWFDLDVASGTLYPIKESRNGYTLDVPVAVQLASAALQTPNQHRLTLPIVIQEPAVSMYNTERLGINELINSNTSYFKGSSLERMQNIEVSASKFHGLVIPPGGIFSFNEHLGDVTAENGFVESLIIQGDRTAVGIGGGVCQVSTTVFRAAFYSGFELVERWAHGYRVGWYETGSGPGLDATIYSPTVDFKFRNDTDGYVLIQTETDLINGTVAFNFYGAPTNRIVIVSEPIESNVVPHGPPIYQDDPSLAPGEIKQVDWSNDGVDVIVTRTVLENDAIIHQDSIYSRYRPWQAVYKVGPEVDGN